MEMWDLSAKTMTLVSYGTVREHHHTPLRPLRSYPTPYEPHARYSTTELTGAEYNLENKRYSRNIRVGFK